MLWKFKNEKFYSIKEFINRGKDIYPTRYPMYPIEWYEICFFDNIDFGNMEYKVIYGHPTFWKGIFDKSFESP